MEELFSAIGERKEQEENEVEGGEKGDSPTFCQLSLKQKQERNQLPAKLSSSLSGQSNSFSSLACSSSNQGSVSTPWRSLVDPQHSHQENNLLAPEQVGRATNHTAVVVAVAAAKLHPRMLFLCK